MGRQGGDERIQQGGVLKTEIENMAVGPGIGGNLHTHGDSPLLQGSQLLPILFRHVEAAAGNLGKTLKLRQQKGCLRFA